MGRRRTCSLGRGRSRQDGARSVRKIVQRAMRAPKSRHLIARFRFNHVIQSIWHDTLPKVLATCFPGLAVKQDKASWFWELPNGSQIWFGGARRQGANGEGARQRVRHHLPERVQPDRPGGAQPGHHPAGAERRAEAARGVRLQPSDLHALVAPACSSRSARRRRPTSR